MIPETIEVETGAKPRAAVIWLHGLGADGYDFEPVVPELGLPAAKPVRAALAEIAGQSAAARARQRRLEQWRERLIGDDGALTEFASQHAGADLQALRALIRNARREIVEGRPPRAQRELFRFLRESSS